jgi:hypothetical protein
MLGCKALIMVLWLSCRYACAEGGASFDGRSRAAERYGLWLLRSGRAPTRTRRRGAAPVALRASRGVPSFWALGALKGPSYVAFACRLWAARAQCHCVAVRSNNRLDRTSGGGSFGKAGGG